MRELADASGVTKPVIYSYFKNKENLCHHLVGSGLERFRQQLQAICDDGDGSIFEQMVRMVQLHFDFCRRNADFVRFIYALNFGPDRRKINYDFYAYGMETLRMMTRLMQRASETGMIRPGKEETAVYYLRGIINTYVMLYVDGRSGLAADVARTIVTDMIYGLAASDSEQPRKDNMERLE